MGDERHFDTSTHSTRTGKSVPLTPEQRKRKQERFLAAYSEIGIIKAACRVAKINRSTYYNWRDNDAEFAALLPDAAIEADETLEYAAYEQSVLGMEEPLVSAGMPVYEQIPVLDDDGEQKIDDRGKPIYKRGNMLVVRKYSPQLLITLLKARMPQKYKDKIEHSGPGGGPIKIDRVDYSRFSAEELVLLEQMARKAEQDGGS